MVRREIKHTSKILVRRKQRHLLVNSDVVILDNPWLHELLIENETITESIAAGLSEQHQNFLNHMLGDTFNRAADEWIGDAEHPYDDLGDDQADWARCALCGTPNRYMFYIVNRLNRKTLNVGSDCIKDFDIDIARNGKSLEQFKREMRRTQRRKKLNERFPGVIPVVDNWDSKLDGYPIVIPTKLERPYVDLGKKAKGFFDGYVNNQLGDEVFDEFERVLTVRKRFIADMDKYVQETHDPSNPFMIRQEIARWLFAEGDRQTLLRLKDEGNISHRNAWRIREPNFMSALVPLLNSILRPHNLEIERVSGNGSGLRQSPSSS